MSVEIIEQKHHKFLWIDGYLWMYDIPAEVRIQRRLAREAFGRVLVAGYGLGIVQRYLSMNAKVYSQTTIEKRLGVLTECFRVYGGIHGTVVFGDFYDWEELEFGKFNCVIGDIWEEIVPENLGQYKKFKAQAEKLLRPGGKILGWGSEYYEYLIQLEGGGERT